MKQVTQTLRDGVISVKDVPVPGLGDKFVLVRNAASVISAGTEKTSVDMAKKNLLQKAKARPDLVKQVLKKLRADGFKKTFQTVGARLDSPSPLGYSSAGTVLAVGGLVEGIKPGDRVACGGVGYANHAEIVAVPRNLVVKVPDAVSDEEAAFTTLGSIGLQGVRLAAPQLGETFLVLGLGILGQMVVQILRANGCRVLGTDLDPSQVELAEQHGAIGLAPGSDVAKSCLDLTGGRGVDGVLVCAGTASNQPIELCGEVTREKGRVVVVGAVRMDIPREDYFKKEISVVISRSYGPGRYDPFYEESGNDYPFGYVRFTEQRNMESILNLIDQGGLDLKSLITHRFDVENAADAYRLIQGEKTEPYLGIVLNYADKGSEDQAAAPRITLSTAPVDNRQLGISFFGAGNYATASLLPPLQQDKRIELRGLVTASGRTAQGVAEKFGFGFCAGDYAELLSNDSDAVMITTRHDTHASAVVQALNAGKHVYVEKPLALSVEELAQVDLAATASTGSQLMVGFNRRFAPLTKATQAFFANVNAPLVVSIRVNAGEIPGNHWIQDPAVGGGRMIGEGCHFVDLASALTSSNVVGVHAYATGKIEKSALLNDNLTVSLSFANGSVANIIYTADGSSALPKEYVEVHGGGRSAIIQDFKEASFYSADMKTTHEKLSGQDKGQQNMLKAWVDGVRSGTACVDYECLLTTSLATIMAVESLTVGEALRVSDVLPFGQNDQSDV
ncbi:MAG: bi-domain-containing oxidoreductase [Gammaproteobacteria bacterium]